MREADQTRFPHKAGDICYSDLKVLNSMAGFYIGRTCWDPDPGFEEPGSRESEYFRTHGEAERALESGECVARDCAENEFAYSRGLPRPRTICAPD